MINLQMKVLIVTMAILIITVNSQDLEMGLCIPCLTEYLISIILDVQLICQKCSNLKTRSRRKASSSSPIINKYMILAAKVFVLSQIEKIYDDKQIHNQSVKICCMKGDIFEKDETIKTNFKHSYDESKDLITIEDTK